MTESSRSPPGSARPRISRSYLKATFDQLYEEGAETPALMSVGLHPRMAGRPARARALAAVLDHILKHDRVWVCRRIDVARHWRAVHPLRLEAEARHERETLGRLSDRR